LGDPNETAPVHEGRTSDMWHYYAQDGTALFVRFIRDQLTDARYERADYGIHGRPVQTVEQELGERDVFKLMADQAAAENARAHAGKYRAPNPRSGGSMSIVTAGNTETTHQDTRARIPREKADSVKEGMTRAEVLKVLGEASGGLKVSGAAEFETLTYALDPSGELSVQLEKGKVTRITR